MEDALYNPNIEEFRLRLSRQDRIILNDLLNRIDQHYQAVAHSGYPLRQHVILLALLLETKKEIRRLRAVITGS